MLGHDLSKKVAEWSVDEGREVWGLWRQAL